jgi:DNA-binding response OmpR family regulator
MDTNHTRTSTGSSENMVTVNGRGSVSGSSTQTTIGNLVMDTVAETITLDGRNISVNRIEFNILCRLLSLPGQVISRHQLLDEFWGVDSGMTIRDVDAHIGRLQNALADCDDFKIVAVRGSGYKAVVR